MAKREAGDDCGGKERAGDGRGRSHTFEGKRSHLATVCNESHRGKTPSVRGDPSLEMLRVHGERAPVGGWPKRAFDIFGAVLALWFFAPFLISIAIAVRLDSAGPSIIRQPRVGFGGRTIRVWDFRCERGTHFHHTGAGALKRAIDAPRAELQFGHAGELGRSPMHSMTTRRSHKPIRAMPCAALHAPA